MFKLKSCSPTLKKVRALKEELVSWPTVAGGNPKAPFSMPTILKGRRYSAPWMDPLTLDPYLIMLLSKEISSTNF